MKKIFVFLEDSGYLYGPRIQFWIRTFIPDLDPGLEE